MSNRWSYSSSAGHGSVQLVEHAAIRRGQQLPGDRAEKGRCHKRRGDQRPNDAPQRQVGAGDQPGERQCRGAGAERYADRDFERRQIRRPEARIGRQPDEIPECHCAAIVGDAVPDEPSERQHDQPAQEQPEQDEHYRRKLGQPERALPLPRNRDGHCYRCRLAQKKVERPACTMRRTPSAQVQPGHGSPSRPYTAQRCWK